MEEFMKKTKRSEQAHAKGFNFFGPEITLKEYQDMQEKQIDFSKIKIGVKTLNNAILNLDNYKSGYPETAQITKEGIYNAIISNDVGEMRRISNLFYKLNGIYQKVCDYFAYLYRFDWYMMLEVYNDNINEEKVLKEFFNALTFFDKSYIKQLSGEICAKVIRDGCYYGYIIDDPNSLIIQQLPIEYCRTRYSVGNKPAVEFNMKFFDTISNSAYRQKVLSLFPTEFQKGYVLYRQGKLIDTDVYNPVNSVFFANNGWYLLNPENTVKFNINNSDIPILLNSIPALIDLDQAQGLERKRLMQQLLKIIIQKLPLDKNSDLVFDVDEARDIHNSAVQMLKDCIGVEVLTTFTDVQDISLADTVSTSSTDNLEQAERTAYNSMGVSRNIFNTDGNLSLEKSILDDESNMRSFLFQMNAFMDRIVLRKNPNSKKYNFKFYFLETTQYNYQTLSKMYKEQTQTGFSKLLPQIALGHSQSFILNAAVFENEILKLSEIMIPPLMSSTLNGEDILGNKNSNNSTKTQNKSNDNSNGEAGRPEKSDDQKSAKTIANRESMN